MARQQRSIVVVMKDDYPPFSFWHFQGGKFTKSFVWFHIKTQNEFCKVYSFDDNLMIELLVYDWNSTADQLLE